MRIHRGACLVFTMTLANACGGFTDGGSDAGVGDGATQSDGGNVNLDMQVSGDGATGDGAVGDGAMGADLSLSSTFINELLAEHNQVRAGAIPVPSPALGALTWSASAASVAQAWADGCVYMHNPGRGNLGENIYASAGLTPTAAGVVGDWASETANYNYANNTCAGVCGHYTQLVWRTTTQVGCAQKHCTTGSPFQGFSAWDYWVCDYSPPGNVNGTRPY